MCSSIVRLPHPAVRSCAGDTLGLRVRSPPRSDARSARTEAAERRLVGYEPIWTASVACSARGTAKRDRSMAGLCGTLHAARKCSPVDSRRVPWPMAEPERTGIQVIQVKPGLIEHGDAEPA